MSDLPKSLQYKTIQPKGFASQFKRWEVYPQTSYNTYNKNELVRFMFQTDHFIDPYQSYLEIEVTMDPTKYNYGSYHDTCNSLLLDGPSTSLISEMVLYCNSKEVERIQEYDQLGVLLDDIGAYPTNKATRVYDGTRYSQVYPNISNSHGARVQSGPALESTTTTTATQAGKLEFYSNIAEHGTSNTFHKFDRLRTTTLNVTNQLEYPVRNQQALFKENSINNTLAQAFITTIFPLLYNTSPYTFARAIYAKSPYTGNIDTYSNILTRFKFMVDGTQNTSWRTDWHSGCNNTLTDIFSDGQFGISSYFGYECTQSSVFNNWSNNGNPTNYASYIDNFKGGCPLAYNYASSFTKSDFINPFVDYQRIRDGKYKRSSGTSDENIGLRISDYTYQMNNVNRVSTRTFYVPILSGVIGQLIPSHEWKLIPGRALGQLMFEWRLNPNAFYNSNIKTSMQDLMDAVNAGNDSASNPAIVQWGLNWTISKFSMHFDLWSFDDYVNQQINQALASEGLVMTSQSFSLGPQYNIANTSQVTNNWQINNGIPSLKTLWFWFISQDYQKYDYCRKNYRLSHNLTFLQLKIGEDYIPTQPIQGKAGNIHGYDSDGEKNSDCIEFMTELDRVVGNFFHQQKPLGLTPANYVLNERPYDPNNVYHCLRGQTGWNEQRQVGKCLYTLDTQSDPHDRTVLSGMDTTRKRPIELILKSDASNPYNSSSLMVVMLHFDMLVLFKLGEFKTVGNG